MTADRKERILHSPAIMICRMNCTDYPSDDRYKGREAEYFRVRGREKIINSQSRIKGSGFWEWIFLLMLAGYLLEYRLKKVHTLP